MTIDQLECATQLGNSLEQQRNELRGQLAATQDALMTYGRHQRDCNANNIRSSDMKCTCGLDDAIALVENVTHFRSQLTEMRDQLAALQALASVTFTMGTVYTNSCDGDIELRVRAPGAFTVMLNAAVLTFEGDSGPIAVCPGQRFAVQAANATVDVFELCRDGRIKRRIF